MKTQIYNLTEQVAALSTLKPMVQPRSVHVGNALTTMDMDTAMRQCFNCNGYGHLQ